MLENINFISADVITLIVSGGVISGLTSILRTKFPQYNTKTIVLVLASFLGIFYQAFISYVPEALQQSIVTFLLGSASFAVAIYEFIWKYSDKKK